MTASSDPIVVEQTFPVPRETLWKAITEAVSTKKIVYDWRYRDYEGKGSSPVKLEQTFGHWKSKVHSVFNM